MEQKRVESLLGPYIHDVFSLRFAVTGVKVIIYDLHVISASVYEFFAFSSVT